MELEQEIKIRLTKKQYELIEKTFTWEDEYDQVNTYYAPVNADKGHHPTVRIRSKKGKMRLEVKIPVGGEGAMKAHEEYSKAVEYIPFIITKQELNELTGRADMQDVYVEGVLATNRKINKETPGTEIALDCNRYLGKTDRELEVEYIGDKLPDEIKSRLEFLKIDYDKQPAGKYHRYKKRLERLK